MCFFKKKVEEPKPEVKQTPVAEEKPEVKEEPAEPAPKKPAPKEEKEGNLDRVYHVSKRASDGMWSIKFAGGQKAIKLFKTKVEAMAAAEEMAKNNNGIVQFHASKGEFAGKIRKGK